MAVDGKMETCTRTEREFDSWWMVDLRETKAIYAINFSFRLYSEDFKSRQQSRLSGYSIYVSNSPTIRSGDLCFKHNGSFPPSLATEHVCASFGRYIQFVNEQYTLIELCDLVVLGCDKRGYYGDNCTIPCPKHCKNDLCFVTNGTCLGCASGWTGINCDQGCSNGRYGPDCLLSCSGHCKNNYPCNSTDGTCSNGCSDGWMGVFCSKTCVSGTFGSDCKKNCSGQCLNDSICNSMTGICESGCNPGYQGELCNKVCSHGFFGHNCWKQCSPSCLGKSCHKINGNCNFGCINGYQGPTCEQFCNSGSHGQNCSLRCEKCVNQSCDTISGMCNYGCEPGWKGPQCSGVCPAGKYGANCMFSCSQNCLKKESCDHVSGVCKNGCSDGYKGEKCSLVSSMTTTRKFGDFWFCAIGMSILVILNALTFTLWICERKRHVKVNRQSSSHYITTEAEMKEKTSESHEYQEVNSVSRDFSYQNLTFDT